LGVFPFRHFFDRPFVPVPAVGVPILAILLGRSSSQIGRLPSGWLIPFQSLEFGVGNEEDTKSKVRGTKGGCREQIPFCIVPDAGQVSEYPSKEPSIRY
jgi:hypothetical protein